jgi:hypothetical protein
MVFVDKLTNLQIELIKLFNYQLEEKQLIEVKTLLARYFAAEATKEMDKLWEQNSWSNETMNEWANEHLRTPYKDEN